jgi:hypothetical protein
VTVNIATHYCGGSFAAAKVSLTGKLATCGMEGTSDRIISDGLYKNHCCDDVTAAYTLSSNYIPSFAYSGDVCNHVNFMKYILVDSMIDHQIFITTSDETIRPPGTFSPNSVERQVICLFRI